MTPPGYQVEWLDLEISVLIGSGLFCLHAEGRDCISVGPDEINGYFGATLPKNGLNPVCRVLRKVMQVHNMKCTKNSAIKQKYQPCD